MRKCDDRLIISLPRDNKAGFLEIMKYFTYVPEIKTLKNELQGWPFSTSV